jgi:hypothetical protein
MPSRSSHYSKTHRGRRDSRRTRSPGSSRCTTLSSGARRLPQDCFEIGPDCGVLKRTRNGSKRHVRTKNLFGNHTKVPQAIRNERKKCKAGGGRKSRRSSRRSRRRSSSSSPRHPLRSGSKSPTYRRAHSKRSRSSPVNHRKPSGSHGNRRKPSGSHGKRGNKNKRPGSRNRNNSFSTDAILASWFF